MARKRSSFGGSLILIAIGYAILSALAQNPQSLIALCGVAIAIWFGWLILNSQRSRGHKATSEARFRATKVYPAPTPRQQIITRSDPESYWLKKGSGGELGDWIYFGKGLASVSGDRLEPALIDPDLAVDATIRDCTVRRLEYWPSYDGASLADTQRSLNLARARWVAGYHEPINQFLYFMGLYSSVRTENVNNLIIGLEPRTAPFFYQLRYVNSNLFPASGRYGLCQYHVEDAQFGFDLNGRVVVLIAPDGRIHRFEYPSATSPDVSSWTVT